MRRSARQALGVPRPTRVSSVPLPASRIHRCPGPYIANTTEWRQSCAADSWRMWSSVLARTLCVKSGGRCSRRSSTRRPGAEGAVRSSVPASPVSTVGAPRGSMMVSPTARGRARVACPHHLAPDHRRPPQEGVEHVTRSMATKRAQVSSSTAEPAWWQVKCFMSPRTLWDALRGYLLHQ